MTYSPGPQQNSPFPPPSAGGAGPVNNPSYSSSPQADYGAAPSADPYQAAPNYGQPTGAGQQPYGQAAPSNAVGFSAYPAASGYGAPQGGGYGYNGAGPIGQVRSTGVVFLLGIITFGIYNLYWYYVTHDEMKKHSGEGLGGGIALLIAFFAGIILPYTMGNEIERLYRNQGWEPPVSALTGLWVFPGIFLIVGPIVWLVKINGALNRYWQALGAQ